MNGEKLYEAIGLIDDKYLLECEAREKGKLGRRLRLSVISGIAAAACIGIVAAGTAILPKLTGGPVIAPITSVSETTAPDTSVTYGTTTPDTSVTETTPAETTTADTSVTETTPAETTTADTSATGTTPAETTTADTSITETTPPETTTADTEKPDIDDDDDDDNPGTGGDGGGEAELYNAPPVLPMTLLNEDGDITAERNIVYDFKSWSPDMTYIKPVNVRDEYTLKNSSAQDKTVTVLYPYPSYGTRYNTYMPHMSVNGELVARKLYTGGYTGVLDTLSQEEVYEYYNKLGEWEWYKELLSDGSYYERALRTSSEFLNVPVTVYEFSDGWCDPEVFPIDDRPSAPISAWNKRPKIRLTYSSDSSKTKVWLGGMYLSVTENGTSVIYEHTAEDDNGTVIREFGLPTTRKEYIIVLGEDISDISYEFYRVHNEILYDSWEKMPEGSTTVKMTRYETDLDTALRKVAGEYRTGGDRLNLSPEAFYKAYSEYMEHFVNPSDDIIERYKDLPVYYIPHDFHSCMRIFYISAEVTVPAGGSVDVSFTMLKDTVGNCCCEGNINDSIAGYETAIKLGTNLKFSDISAGIENYGSLEIVKQNFGFDLDNGVDAVTLDPNKERYYFRVRKVSEQQ